MDACVEVDIDFDDHLNPSNMRFSVFVGLVGEGASRTLGAQKLCPPVGKARRCVVPPLSVSCPVAQLKSSPPVRERRGLISHQEHTFRSEFNVNGTTL